MLEMLGFSLYSISLIIANGIVIGYAIITGTRAIIYRINKKISVDKARVDFGLAITLIVFSFVITLIIGLIPLIQIGRMINDATNTW